MFMTKVKFISQQASGFLIKLFFHHLSNNIINNNLTTNLNGMLCLTEQYNITTHYIPHDVIHNNTVIICYHIVLQK